MKKTFSIIFKIIICITTFVGLLYSSELLNGYYDKNQFVYYTNLSNLVVFVYFLSLVIMIFIGKQNRLFLRYKGLVTLLILVTGLIYDFLLADYSTSGWHSVSSICLHYLAPYLVLLDWVIFDRDGNYKKIDPLIWTIIPLTYVVFIFIRSLMFDELTLRYPYFFLDIDTIGGGVMIWIILIFIAFLLLGYFIYYLDKVFSGKAIFLKKVIAVIVLKVLFRAIRILSRKDERVLNIINDYKEGFSLSLCLYRNGPSLNIIKENGKLKTVKKNDTPEVLIEFKSMNHSFKVLTGRMSVAEAYSKHLFILKGNIGDSMPLVDAIEIVEDYLFPKFMTKNILKENITKQMSVLKLYVMIIFNMR